MRGKEIMSGPAELEKLTPRKAVRKICLDCMGDKLYTGPCIFYPYRLGRKRISVKLIRKNCLWCMGGSSKSVEECPGKTCPLLPYRFGKNPKLAGKRVGFRKQAPDAGLLPLETVKALR